MKLAQQVLTAYDASVRHIPDSDLDDEQPISLNVRTTLGDIRRIRSFLATLARGEKLIAADLKARDEYDASL